MEMPDRTQWPASCGHHPVQAAQNSVALPHAIVCAIDASTADVGLLLLLGVVLILPQRRLRTRVFLGDTIPWWLAPAGYGGLAVVSTIFIPMIYTPVKWYFVLVAYIIAPLFALPVSACAAVLVMISITGMVSRIAPHTAGT